MKTRFTVLLALVLSPWFISYSYVAKADALGELSFITENYAPFNYQKGGQIRGSSVELLLKMFKHAGTDRGLGDIEVMNWARGYNLAQTKLNTVLFSTTRTKSREDLFKWVGPISPTKILIIGKRESNITVNSNEDLKRYRIGAVRDDIGELLLLRNGIGSDNIYRTNSSKTTAKMLIANRIDLWAYEGSVAFFNLREQGEDPNDYKTLKVLEESHLYFAIQKDTSDELVTRLQRALDEVRTAEK
ncbi:MAG: ABC transporter substrate-binding protein [Rhodospirillaceae bacterium]|nr:ABC transporter substrate-binding protein [Rhodospirillaceae bacterium]